MSRPAARCGVAFLLALVVGLGFAALPAKAQPGRPLRLVVFGDSLSGGFLLPVSASFPVILEQQLRARGYPVSVTNASYTNDTSWAAYYRLDRDVPAGTDAVIVELGANDQLLRTDPSVTQGVLQRIVGTLRARRIAVLVAGFRMPFEWGAGTRSFDSVYQTVARQYGVAYYPDFYAGLWTEPSYTGLDRVHPSPAGVQRIVNGILPSVARLLDTVRRSGR